MERVTIARLRNEVEEVRKEKNIVEMKAAETSQKLEKTMQTVTAEKEQKPQEEQIAQKMERQEEPVQPSRYLAGEYHAAFVDANGRVVSYLPVERTVKKKDTHLLSAIFSRQRYKKKIDIIRLVAEKDLEPKQLMQVRSAIEKGLDEQQLLVLINHQLPAEQMEEIINIAVYENERKQEA